MPDYVVGIDLGGTNIKLAILDDQGIIVARETLQSQIGKGPQSLVERVAAAVVALAPAAGLKAVGIGSPGPIALYRGEIIKGANLPGFDNFPLRARLSEALQLPAIFDNDANAACWAEFWLGAGQGTTDMALFTLGTGVGGGLVYGGELLHGSDGNAAELGHTIVQPDGPLCNCGQRGCLEAYASATHMVKRAYEAFDEGVYSSLGKIRQQNGSVSAKDIFDHARNGDPLANEIVDDAAGALAQACVNIRHITEPQRVVLAGGLAKAGDILVPRVREFFGQMIWSLQPEPMEICLAQLGPDAGVLGAAGLALHALGQDRLCPIGT